ncbi:hypothetical protein [uncultured Mucilaginibacter sp.]|uniref:hypothetical protein n=1 Tax=uncultured Mucilaginibacter sp. TaxID=797541 RepID=UPI002615BAB7|nr:hypothetical protein [uncultured Mucilaginibacter sp.]
MLNNEIIVKRLSLIKYLYKIGLDQSKQSETVAWLSILSLHDSIEMFLKLVAENQNIKSDSFNFLDYWTSVPTLTLKESMRNLNARRVNIKHKGLLPSKSDIEITRVNAKDFFEQNTLPLFNIDFDSISLFSLIIYEPVKKLLESAQIALDENRIEDCIESAAFAFDELLFSYEGSKTSYHGHSPFYFGKSLRFSSSFSMRNNGKDLVGPEMSKFVDSVKESIGEIQKVLKIISFGIDYKKYTKFQLLSPTVRRTMDGKQIARLSGERKWHKENCQYCIDFVLDSTLNLQNFDFDINELVEIKEPVWSVIPKLNDQ